MSHNIEKAQDKPVLSAEGFQRLLSAAFILQAHNYSRPPLPLIGGGRRRAAAAEAVVQKRTPSLQPQLHAAYSDGWPIRSLNRSSDQPNLTMSQGMAPVRTETSGTHEETSARQPAPALMMLREGVIPKQLGFDLAGQIPLIDARKLMRWRTVEALAIATVFGMLMGASIHRVSLPGDDKSPSSEMAEPPTARWSVPPAAEILALSGQLVTRSNSRQSADRNEADVVAEDVVTRYQKRASDMRDQPEKHLTSSPVRAQRSPRENTM